MSYIQVEIGGKLRGLKFNQGAIMWMQDKVDPTNFEATTGYAIVWGGLRANCYVKGDEFGEYIEQVDDADKKVPKFVPYTFEQVCDWVDALPLEINKLITECFQESEAWRKRLASVEDSDKKKLSPEPSTEPSASELQAS